MSSTGEKDRYVTIQKMTESRDATTKAPVETWSTLGHSYMSMRPMRGSERFTAEQMSAAGNTEWEMDYRADMDPELLDVPKTRRLQFRGRTYDITSANHEGMRRCIALHTLVKAG